VPELSERAACRAPAEEVWKLLHDPERFPDWWAGTERVEPGDGGEVTRYLDGWPDFPMPTAVATRREAGAIVISCLRSDIVHEWTLLPAADGCEIAVRVTIPEEEAGRREAQRAEIVASLARLVEVAEAAA
jgi:uncharacterized protein YndB with AHSA1/START domain